MYHSISDSEEAGVAPYYKICTSPRRFAEHMQWLADWGYRCVTISEGLAMLGQAGQEARDKGQGIADNTSHVRSSKGQVTSPKPQPPSHKSELNGTFDLGPGTSTPSHLHPHFHFNAHSPPEKLVALTFDDGFRDFFTEAFPILKRHNYSATMYLPTAYIGDKRCSFNSRECLTWDEVRELHKAGIEFGAHSVNHPEVEKLSWPRIEDELRESKSMIERQLSDAVTGFAYPYAFPQSDRLYVRQFRNILPACGYRSCVTTAIGRTKPGDDALHLTRLPANTEDDHPLLAAKLRGDYDWMAGLQRAYKAMKPAFPALRKLANPI